MADTTRQILPVDGGYVDEITVLLRDLLRRVIRERAPEVLAIIDNPEDARTIKPELVAPALQVIGIWLQLLNIAEENAAMRSRRRLETMGGNDQILGSFSNAFATIAAAGAPGEAVAKALNLDPVETRRKNFIRPHQFPYKTPGGSVYDSGDYELATGRALEMAGYEQLREEQLPMSANWR